ncbi:Acyltransferase domain-containing protein [Sulfidibacter corallicola]|uniref:Acyltransferase domain-containing protein n=1 Tax=Sulfidibacter corallicola TaxID=2818388 RepID=A0A8A4TEP8_SULCO|nr:type I polyketide synthase [Sulfidibacter corallicola]QTD48020.1 acyltransferase domain-containing protein [Sulfidibacter corallicola]
MKAMKLLSHLKDLKVRIWVEEEKLRCKAAPGVLTKALKRELAEHKEEIMRILRKVHADSDDRNDASAGSKRHELSSFQTRIWLQEQLYPDQAFNKVIRAVLLKGIVNFDFLSQSIKEIIQRNLILKSCFPSQNGLPVHALHDKDPVFFKITQKRSLNPDEKTVEIDRQIEEEYHSHFVLDQGPLIRCRWIIFSDEEHLLIITFHRICGDEHSADLILDALVDHYRQLEAGEAIATNGEDRSHYGSFTKWYKQWQTQPEYKHALMFWGSHLPKKQRRLRMCFEKDLRERPEFHQSRLSFAVPEPLARQVETRAEDLGMATSDLFAAAFFGLLHHCTSSNRIIIGMPYDLRPHAEVGDQLGYYENLLPISVTLGSQDNRTFLESVSRDIKNAYKHGCLPFEAILKEGPYSNNLNFHPLVNFLFEYQRKRDRVYRINDLEIEKLSIQTQGSLFDLKLQVTNHSAQTIANFFYRDEIYPHQHISLLPDFYLKILTELCNEKGSSITSLSFLTAEWEQRIKDFKPDTDHLLASSMLLHEQITKGLTAFPDQVVMGERDELTFADLNRSANRLAHLLMAKGVEKGDYIGIGMRPKPDCIAAMLAVLKVGGSFVILDPDLPLERLNYYMDKTPLKCIITSPRLQELYTEFDATIIISNESENEEAQYPDHEPDVSVDGSDLAFVSFISSEAGSPRAIFHSHASICRQLLGMKHAFRLGEQDRVLQNFWPMLEAFVWESILPLLCGSRLYFDSLLSRQYGSRFSDRIAKHQITMVYLNDDQVHELIREFQPKKCRSLRTIITNVTMADDASVHTLADQLSSTQIYHLYSVPEAGGAVAYLKRDLHDDKPFAAVTPFEGQDLWVLDEHQVAVPPGIPGEIHVAVEESIAANKDVLLPHPQEPRLRLIGTRDRGTLSTKGAIRVMGAMDRRIEINGVQVALGEIEALAEKFDAIEEAYAYLSEEPPTKTLSLYYTFKGTHTPHASALSRELQKVLPDFMLPEEFIPVTELPKAADGTVDIDALLEKGRHLSNQRLGDHGSTSVLGEEIAKVWRDVLEIDHVHKDDNFFDLGGDSLQMCRVYEALPPDIKSDLTLSYLFQNPTIEGLEKILENKLSEDLFFSRPDSLKEILQKKGEELCQSGQANVAIVGMAVRLPGATTLDQFWKNLSEGVESISYFSKEELAAEGADPELLDDPDYIRAMAILDDFKSFDYGFFKFTPREAQLTDPQQRLFLECVWEALEQAGYDPKRFKGKIGVYGGVGVSFYLNEHLLPNHNLLENVGQMQVFIGNDRDTFCTRVAYKMDFQGPSATIQAACSTVLVSTHMAVRALRGHDADMMIVGGVSLRELYKKGYLYEEGLLYPPDGHIRPFDEKARGSVNGQGCTVLVLKRLEDALQQGDQIYGIIKGSAVNNDGIDKVGFTAFSPIGQQKVIEAGLASAEVQADSVSYVESSSTASPSGDPMEVEALTKAFGKHTEKRQYCALGAVKPNIGATDVAAGGAAFIKTALALKHRAIPPTINYETPHPKINFLESPFYVPTELAKWDPPGGVPRRACVEGFGLGGANAHLVLEEPPAMPASIPDRPWHLLLLSAPTRSGLEAVTDQFVDFLKNHHQINMSDVAYTLQAGRHHFKYRRMVVCQNVHEAIFALERRDPKRILESAAENNTRPIAFMFPGQGSQYLKMGHSLYQVEPTYRTHVDHCWARVQELFSEFYEALSEKDRHLQTSKIHQTYITQLSLFVLEYALAKTLISWGIAPDAMIGNSTGEYTAACLSGVLSLDDALRLIVGRGKLMQTLPPGRMAEVNLSEEEIQPYLSDKVALAGCAGPSLSVVSGTEKVIHDLYGKLSENGIIARTIFASHAFHSPMVDRILNDFADLVKEVSLNPPEVPFISCITGDWISRSEAVDPYYWARQQRRTVRFAQGIEVLFKDEGRILLEVGPDRTLSAPAIQTQNELTPQNALVLASMKGPNEERSDVFHLLRTLGRLWLGGVCIDWDAFHQHNHRYRLALPTYPFERKEQWIQKLQFKSVQEMKLNADEIETTDDEDDELDYRSLVNNAFVAPRDDVELFISQQFQEVLGVPQIGIHDDFFELGGSSLIAVRLMNRLSKEFAVPLATHIMLQKRTIAALAEVVREYMSDTAAGEAANTPLVPIKLGDTKTNPIYMAHPVGGEVMFYREFAHYLGAKRPVYGLRSLSLTGLVDPYDDLVKQAKDYVDEMLKFRQSDFYILGGASYGGVLAYEMAQQLLDMGKEVPLLIIIDSPAPGAMPRKLNNSAGILHYMLGDELDIEMERLEQLNEDEQMSYIYEAARAQNRVDLLPNNLGKPMFKTWLYHEQAMHAYRPKPYPRKVMYFRPSEALKINPLNMYEPWIDFVKGGIEIVQVGGNHITMNYGENGKKIAHHVKKELKGLGL